MREAAWSDPAGVALRDAQREEIELRYQDPNSEPGPAPGAHDITLFVIAEREDGTAIGCGALRQLDDRHCEVKRMFVVPEQRGSGAATAILRELERRAGEFGWDRLVLETGDRQPDAVRFYEREGYVRIASFGYYAESEHSLCYERRLT